MSEGEVDDEHPRADKKKQGGEFNSFRDRPDDQCRSDDGEHHLIHAENILGNPVGVIGVRSRCHSLQEGELQPAEDRAVKAFSKNQTVAHRPPENGDQPGDSLALG